MSQGEQGKTKHGAASGNIPEFAQQFTNQYASSWMKDMDDTEGAHSGKMDEYTSGNSSQSGGGGGNY